MEILTSVKRLYISFKSPVNDFVYSFGRAALLLLVEVYNHTVPVRERGRIRVKYDCIDTWCRILNLYLKNVTCINFLSGNDTQNGLRVLNYVIINSLV